MPWKFHDDISNGSAVIIRVVSSETSSGKFPEIYRNFRNSFIGNLPPLQHLPNNCAVAYNDTFQRLLQRL